MKAKFGMMMVDGRGKLGGHVLSKNRGGAYARTKVSPINAQTAFQTAARSTLTYFAQSFRTLTAAQILAWNGATNDFKGTDVFGDIKTPSGINLYVKLNANITNIGGVAIATPPLPQNVPQLTGVVVTAAAGAATVSINTDQATVGAGTRLLVEATSPQSPGKSFVKSEFRVIGASATNAAFPLAEGANYTAKFGALVSGQKLFVRITSIDLLTGIASLPQTAFCSIAP